MKLIFLHYSLEKLGPNLSNFIERLTRYEKAFKLIKPDIDFEFHYWSKEPMNLNFDTTIIFHKKENFFKAVLRFYKYLKVSKILEQKVAVVAGDNTYSLILAEMIKRNSNEVKIQGSFHGSLFAIEQKNIALRQIKVMLNKRALKSLDSIRIVNKFQQMELAQFSINLTGKNIEIIPIPILIPNLIKLNVKKTLGFVGRIHSERGIVEWVRIAGLAFEKNLIEEVIVVGDGEDRDTFLSELSKIKGLPVKYLGYISNPKIELALKQIRILLSTAPSETYGMTLREAAASGILVLAKENLTVVALEKASFGIVRSYTSVESALLLIKVFGEVGEINQQAIMRYRNSMAEESNLSLENLAKSWANLF